MCFIISKSQKVKYLLRFVYGIVVACPEHIIKTRYVHFRNLFWDLLKNEADTLLITFHLFSFNLKCSCFQKWRNACRWLPINLNLNSYFLHFLHLITHLQTNDGKARTNSWFGSIASYFTSGKPVSTLSNSKLNWKFCPFINKFPLVEFNQNSIHRHKWRQYADNSGAFKFHRLT